MSILVFALSFLGLIAIVSVCIEIYLRKREENEILAFKRESERALEEISKAVKQERQKLENLQKLRSMK